ncbi:MAG: hypothetical protein KF833_06705 [Verrucomicrobiae bacterium]|nr:hypothetical protein [Verrucomicrobiae bacterium]
MGLWRRILRLGRALALALAPMGVALAVTGQATPMPDFRLEDINPGSPRAGTGVSPRDYVLGISVFYFASLGCDYCRTQYGHLDAVLREVTAARPGLRVSMVAVNHASDGTRPALGEAVNGAIPWLQDTAAVGAWARWGVEWRDLVVLDAFNRPVSRDNLTERDLGEPRRREILRDGLLALAEPVDSDGDGLPDVWEIYWSGGLGLAPDEDPDGDGFDNRTEWAMGTNPLDGGSRPQVSLTAERTGELGALPRVWVTFRRFGGRVPLRVETSQDWLNWAGMDVWAEEAAGYRDTYDGTGTVQVRFPLAGVGESPFGFVRVRAVRDGAVSW